jgi:hypothetical protein
LRRNKKKKKEKKKNNFPPRQCDAHANVAHYIPGIWGLQERREHFDRMLVSVVLVKMVIAAVTTDLEFRAQAIHRAGGLGQPNALRRKQQV